MDYMHSSMRLKTLFVAWIVLSAIPCYPAASAVPSLAQEVEFHAGHAATNWRGRGLRQVNAATQTSTRPPTRSVSRTPSHACWPTKTSSRTASRSPSLSPSATKSSTRRPTPILSPSPVWTPQGTWTVVWGDEFDGTQVDASKWSLTEGRGVGSLADSSLQSYTAGAASVAGGQLVITAGPATPKPSPSFISARLTSYGKFSLQYGLVAARLKLPRGGGVQAKFWLIGNNLPLVGWPASGEIDVVQLDGGVIGRVSQTGPEINGDRTIRAGTWRAGASNYPAFVDSGLMSPLPADKVFADDFHVFEVEWTASNLTFRVDSATYWSTPLSSPVFQAPFFLGLEVSLANPLNQSVLPQALYADWVRVYQPPIPSGAPTPTPSRTFAPLSLLTAWDDLIYDTRSYDMIGASTLDYASVSDANVRVPATTALRIDVTATSTQPSDAAVLWVTSAPCLPDDTLLLSFWVRPVAAAPVVARISFEGGNPLVGSLQKDFTVDAAASWTQLSYQFKPVAAFNTGKARVQLEYLFSVQTFDIAAVTLLNLGQLPL